MSATSVIASAPLGSTIHYSDGQPRPPQRFRKKLEAWERLNGSGLLVQKSPARKIGDRHSPPSFTLRTGVYGISGVPVLVVNHTFDTRSTLAFRIDAPPAGSVQLLTGEGERAELRFLAPCADAARAWLLVHKYRDARLVEVLEGGVNPLLTAT